MKTLKNITTTVFAIAVGTNTAQLLAVPIGPVRDQGRIFSTDGVLQLGTHQWSQSITTGIGGKLSGIQIQFYEGLPSTVPALNFSIFAGGNPTSGPALFSERLVLTSADLDDRRLFTWDLSSADLLFDVGDRFSFGFQAERNGHGVSGNDPPGYGNGELFKNRVASSELSDIAFITYVTPVPEPSSISIVVLSLFGLLTHGHCRRRFPTYAFVRLAAS